ncbi:MAG TPA: metallophosphoesterase [Bacteroidota bacterium]|nr:metallophosphoesterase [Bacteroidota bacterium]
MSRRAVQFIIFFSIFVSVYTLVNSYIFLRGWEVVPKEWHSWYAVLFVVLAYSFLLGRVLERLTISWFSAALVWVGSYWLAAMVYLLLSLYAIDILRLINHVVPIFPPVFNRAPRTTAQIVAVILGALVLVVVVAGHLNASNPRIRKLDISIPKNSRALKSLNIVAASDIHLGTIIGRRKLDRIVSQINSLSPDLVLLPGDIFDEDIGPVIKKNLGEMLRSIRSKYGVIAVTGNHEYIGGVEPACSYMTAHGILVLRDAVTTIGDSVLVVGREDRSISGFAGKKRKSLDEILAGVDKSYPIILMDHQPFTLDEAVANGVDFQISGHTHHGQIWPFGYIARKIYEVSWGYKKKGSTHIYVSCGVGTWGPPVRTGNRPEIVNVRVKFQ